MTTMKCVLVTGGRGYSDRKTVFDALDALKPNILMEGGAAGADALAREWATKNGAQSVMVPANWNRLGRAAGPVRNTMMVTILKAFEKAGWECSVVAFPGGAGTASCVSIATDNGFVVKKVE